MKHYARIAALSLAVAVATGCETDSRSHETDDGGILLSISRFGTIPVVLSASDGYASIDSITVQSIVKNPGQGSSQLMTVELDSYEVTYSRLDTGTRVPPRLKEYFVGTVTAGGTFTLLNGPYMRYEQFVGPPLEDLRELGYDPETNSTVIRLKVGIQFFGRTITGDVVQTEPGYFTLDVVP
jgi:hypothetical protein